MTGISSATRAFEHWMRGQIVVVERDLRLKHQLMASGAFPCLRATFYRWVPLWREACADLAVAPELLAVGDLHVENFGTWRDREGRLAWGINDFDEAFRMPYTIDLVRLATSALLARREEALAIEPEVACAAILEGYRETLDIGGRAFVLEERFPTLRALAYAEERDPDRFWSKLHSHKTVRAPRRIASLLQRALPKDCNSVRVITRVAGMGALGHPRYVALATCHGSLLAREAKAAMSSAYAWALGRPANRIYSNEIAAAAIRAADPFTATTEGWLLRRIGPHCSRIELADFPKRRDERRILRAMGREAANVHLGNGSAIAAVRRDLAKRAGKWLLRAAATMADATIADWKDWRRTH